MRQNRNALIEQALSQEKVARREFLSPSSGTRPQVAPSAVLAFLGTEEVAISQGTAVTAPGGPLTRTSQWGWIRARFSHSTGESRPSGTAAVVGGSALRHWALGKAIASPSPSKTTWSHFPGAHHRMGKAGRRCEGRQVTTPTGEQHSELRNVCMHYLHLLIQKYVANEFKCER